jgi:hypothetical protein
MWEAVGEKWGIGFVQAANPFCDIFNNFYSKKTPLGLGDYSRSAAMWQSNFLSATCRFLPANIEP